jgi:uncharacterized metal-binding protein YceD (DUF177 family)
MTFTPDTPDPLPLWASQPPQPAHVEPWLMAVQTIMHPSTAPSTTLKRTLHLQGELAPYLGDDTPEWQALLEVTLTYHRKSAGFTVVGQAHGQLLRHCDVCLTPYVKPIAFSVDERYGLATLALHQNKERQLDDADWYEEIDPKGVVDLAHLITQLVIAEYTQDNFCDTHADRAILPATDEAAADDETTTATHQPLANLQAQLNALLADDPDQW